MTRASGRTGVAIVMVCIASAVAAVAGEVPASAAVQSIAPSSATITAGEAASATVRVDAAGVVCLQVSQPHPTISASVDRECDAGPWQTALHVRSSGGTPAGTYTVSVSDGESSRAFTLRVQAQAPPTTSTTVRPTTTAPRPTTTQAPATTTPPTTAAPTTLPPTTAPLPTTTTSTMPLGPGELRGEPFAPTGALVDAGIPEEGVFIPLTRGAFAECLPLRSPCADPSSPLVLVPARAHGITWSPVASDDDRTPLLASRGLESLQVVGTEPAGAATATFSLAVLDLGAGTAGDVVPFDARLDDQRRLVPADDGAAAGAGTVSATLEPPVTAVEREPSESESPFGRPYRLSTRGLTEASPALVAHGSANPQVLYALRAPESWNLGRRAIPLLGNGRVPYLARNVDGPPGLLVPIPAEIADDLRPAPDPRRGEGDLDDTGGVRAADAPLVIAASAVAAVLAFAALRIRRRRRRRR